MDGKEFYLKRHLSFIQGIAFHLQLKWNEMWAITNGDTNSPEWGLLYDYVFSEVVASRIARMFPGFTWLDPDTTYYADVTAYINGFNEYVGNLTKETLRKLGEL